MKKDMNLDFSSRSRGIIFIFIGIFFFGIFVYRSLFIINSQYRNSYRENREQFFNKEKWCEEQKKYFPKGTLFYPIAFTSQSEEKNKNQKGSEDIILRNGYVRVTPQARATILICHGFMTNKEDMFLLRYFFKDFNVVTFDFRAHGENASLQRCTLGYDERHDVIAAAKYIKSDQNLKDLPLFVYGFSMGAVASIFAQGEEDLFDGAIWDCPFESTNELTNQALSRLKCNFFGFDINFPLKNAIKKYIYSEKAQKFITLLFKFFARLDGTNINMLIKKSSPLKSLKNITIPFFLIGCHNDDKAPASSIENMFYQHEENSFVRCWISEGRRHFDAIFINPEKYIYKIKKFIFDVLDKKINNKKRKKIEIDDCIYRQNNKKTAHTNF
jgi:pimeloyl-ACP methyl ester carboxylesterase